MCEPISIVIPAHNQLEYCRQCIESIQIGTTTPYQLILVDNGSTDGVGEYFDAVAGATVVHSSTNLGFAGGVNLGIERATGHVLLLNSDTLVPRHWLARLLEALESGDDIGMVGPMSNYVSGIQAIDNLAFTSVDEVNAFSDNLYREARGQLQDVDRLVGFCMLIREEAVKEVGIFDESFGIGNYEDDDYCIRVRACGYRLCAAHGCFVFHYGNRTFFGLGICGESWDELLEENSRRFQAKWNTEPSEDRARQWQQAHELNRQARQTLDGGDLTGAARLFMDAIGACPQMETNFNDLGAVLWQLGERERAYDQFVKAIMINPAFGDARKNLRDAAKVLGRIEESEAIIARYGGNG